METFRRFIIGLLISLFILPLQLIPTDYSHVKAAPPAKDIPASQVVVPPKEGKIELTDKRTATSKTYLKSDGKKEMVVYQSPVNYQDSKNQWQEIDVNLQSSRLQIVPTAPKEYENTANDFRVSLSENLSKKAFSLQKNGAEVDLKLSDIRSANGTSLGFTKEGLNNIKPERYQNRLTYKNVYKDTDIIYYSMTSGIKEDIVLNSYSGQNQFVFDLNISNASYEKQKDGSYIFYKPGTKEIQFRMPKFYMWDNKGGKDSESNQYSYDVGTEIVDKNGSLSVVLTANNNWLSSKDRVFPITIDPSFVTNDIEDTYVQTGYPDTQAWNQGALWIGQGSTKGVMRALVLFNVPVPDLYGAKISSSRFEVLQYGNCTGVCTSAGVTAYTTTNFNPWESTWNYRPTELARAGNAFNSSTWDWFVMDVTSAASHWIYNNNDGSVPGGLEFVQDGESNWGYRTWAAQNNPDYTWGQPRLVIEYNDYNAQYIPTDVPNAIAGSETEIPVTLGNSGRNTWTKDQFKLSYHLINNTTGEQVIFDGLRTDLPKDVVKGDSVSVLARFKAPPVAGNYTIQWDIIQEGVTWFSSQGVPTSNKIIAVSPPSFSSMTHLGTESYYAKAGPVDLANGNLSYSSTDLSVASTTGGLSVGRSYNSSTIDQTFSHDSDGYIRTWLLNGPYKENDTAVRLTRSYISGEDTVGPSEGSTSAGNLWFKNDSSSNYTDLNSAFDKIGAVQNGRATNMAAYANIYVYTPTTKRLKLKTGSQDGIKIWKNGSIIRSNDVYRGLTLDSDVDDVTLYSGWSTLLIKTTMGSGGWNMAARFTNPDGTPVGDLKYALNCPEVAGGSKISAKGWTFNFDQKLFINDLRNIYYRDGTGTINIFTKNLDGSYNTPAGTDTKLVANADHSFTFTNKSGSKTNFFEDAKIANSSDLLGNKIEYQYDSSYPRKCIKIVDGSRYITITYSGERVASVSDQLGNKISYTYDASGLGNLVKVTDPNNVSFSYVYGSDGKMAKFNDKKLNATQIVYSGGKVSQLTDAQGNVTKFNYLNKSTEITDALGRKSTANFNQANLLTGFTNAKNYKELYAYDGKYNTLSVTPAILENDQYYYKWSYTYDGENNLLSETNPENAVTSYLYSGNDLVKTTDPQGNYSQYTYSTDGKRLLLSSTDPKGNKNTYIYDANGRVISETDPKGAISKNSYNADSDLLTYTSPKNEVTRFSYNAIGQKIADTSQMGFVTKYSYDKNSRLISVVDPGGLKIIYTYDLNDNKIRETYPNSAGKSLTYDSLDRLTKATDEIGAAMSYQYDAVGNKIKVTDANGKATTFVYDELNQPTKQIDPTGKSIAINYDRNSNVSSATDQKGNTSSNTYNKNGDLITTDSGGTKTTLTLNKNSDVTKITTSSNQTTNVVYDKNSNPTSVTSSVLGSTANAYDQNNNLVQSNVTSAVVKLSYDANGALSSVASQLVKTGTNLGTTTYSNDLDGKLRIITKPNGDTTTYGYDSSGRVVSLANKNKLGVTKRGYSYTYDLASNQTAILDNSGFNMTYGYDLRNELTLEATRKYTYDLMGNRTLSVNGTRTISYAYDTAGDANRLKKVTYPSKTVSYEYDNSGNIIKEIDSASGTTTYVYDSDNYFTQATLPNGTIVSYTYDKATKLRSTRSVKTSAGVTTTTKFDYSGDKLVSEMDLSNNVLKSYTWDEQENLNSITIPVSGVMTTYYYVKNAKGDVMGMSDKNGMMVVDYYYDAWGNIVKARNLVTTGIPTDLYKQNSRLYSSYWYDYDLGLYFMKTRLYDPEIGRFMSKDTEISDLSPLAYNPYIYAFNNPIKYIDPSGKQAVAASMGLVALGGAASFNPVGWLIAGVAIAVGLTAWAVYEVYNYYSSTGSTSYTQSSSSSISSGASCPASPGNNNKNKKSKNKSSSSKNTQPSKPRFEYKEEWKIKVSGYNNSVLENTTSLRHTSDQQALKEIMEETIAKRGGFRNAQFTKSEAESLVEWGKETGFKDARIDPPHTETINFNHLHVGPVDYIRVVMH